MESDSFCNSFIQSEYFSSQIYMLLALFYRYAIIYSRALLQTTMQQKVVKGLLKFKNTNSSNVKKATVELPPKEHKKQQSVSQPKKDVPSQETSKPIFEQTEEQRQFSGKTAAQRAFEIAKKTRLIHKQGDRIKLTNRERLEKRNKILSKLPDHQDLFKTGQKIQKGY